MNPNHVYILDANVFIESAKRYHALDIAPGFWNALVYHAENGSVLSIDRVKTELQVVGDAVHNWAEQEFQQWFESSNQSDVIEAYRTILTWAFNQDFTEDAKREFANKPDSWLIAYSYSKDYTLVTDEKYEPHHKNRIKIPNVCKEFNVRYMDTFQMLRDLNIKWE